MNICIKKSISTKYIVITIILLFVAFILACARYDVPLDSQLLFLLSQVIFVLIPGIALVSHICPQKDKLMLMMISYLAGIFITIAMYFIFYGLKIQHLLTIAMCVLSIASFVCIFKKRSAILALPTNNSNTLWVILVVFALCFTILLISFRTNRLPSLDLGASFNYYQDMLWNTGNLTAIANGFPVQDIHVNGLSFSYHFLTSVFLAVFKNILGISSFILNFRFLGVLQAVVFVCAAYPLFSLVVKCPIKRMFFIALTFFASTLLLQHILYTAYATLFAFSFSIIAGYFFIKYIQEDLQNKKLFNPNFIMFLIFLCVALGTKSLFGGILAAGCAVIFLINIKQNPKKMLINGFITLFIVLFIAIVMTYGTHTSNALSFEFATPMLGENPVYFKIAKDYLGDGINTSVLMYPIYLVLSQSVLILSSVLLLIALIKKKFKQCNLEIFLIFLNVVGILFASVLYQPGYSNMLFFVAPFPFAIFSIIYTISNFNKGKKPWIIVSSAVLLLSLLQAITGAHTYHINMNTYRSVPNPYDSITYYEYEALEWLRTNTKSSDIIVGDRVYISPSGGDDLARSYYYSTFAERPFYIEGYYYANAYNKDFKEIIARNLANQNLLYSGDIAIVETLKQQGVKYVLSSSAFTPDFILDESLGELVFNNGSMYIYRLTGA